jgi:general L-amino acid transport system permease protein
VVSGVGIIFTTIVGVLVGVARLSNNWLINKFCAAYTWV